MPTHNAFRNASASVLGVGLVLLTAACGGAATGPDDNADAAGETVQATGAGEPAETAETAEPAGGAAGGAVGIVEFDTTSVIDAQFVDGARAALEEQGYEVLSQDPKGDPGQANTVCTQYVTREVKAIVVTTFALDQMAQCMSQATAADVPVFYIGSPLIEGMAGSVDVTSPMPINDVFAEHLDSAGVTDILTLDYTPGTPCRVRAEYRSELLAERDVEVSLHEFPIPGQVVDSQNATAAWLAAHPEGAGTYAIWSCTTDPTIGALAAMAQAGRDDVVIYTWDFNEGILEPLRTGLVGATLSLEGPAVGAQVADLIAGYLADGEPVGVAAESTVLTAENIDAYIEENPESL